MKRILIVFVMLAVALTAVLVWKLKLQQAELQRPPGSSGVVEGTSVLVASRLPARITALHAREGERVEAGALLVELDCAEPDAGVAAASAQVEAAAAQVAALKGQVEAVGLQARAARKAAEGQRAQVGSFRAQGANARKQRARAERLQQEQVMPDATVEGIQATAEDLAHRVRAAQEAAAAAEVNAQAVEQQARAMQDQVAAAERNRQAAEAALARARALQAECRVTAPRAGTVTLRVREPGEVVLPGATIYEIIDYSEVKVKFYVSNAQLARVALGQAVRVEADALPGQAFDGVVRRVAEVAEFTPRSVQTRSDRDRLVYAVEALVPNPGAHLRAGMPVEVTLAEGK
jgi:HlyD family secretion protein